MVLRATALAMAFVPLLVLAPFAMMLSSFREICWFPLLAFTLGQLGAAFIKWAQWSSTRPDLFPEALCRALAPLTHAAPRHSWGHTKKKVEAALEAPLTSAFEDFDPVPLASGSVAQVHRATLKGRAGHVAVKVTHPKVAERLAVDFALMGLLARAVDLVTGGWLNLEESTAQFASCMAGQADLGAEAAALDHFNWNFRRWRDAKFPRPLLRSPDVLVESFEEGMLVSKYSLLWQQSERQRKAGGRRRVLRGGAATAAMDPATAHFIVRRGEDMYLKMLLADNLMHADLHPGNILVQSEGGVGLCVLDAGMVAKLTPEEQRNFVGFISNLAKGDGARAGRCLLRFSAAQTCRGEVATGRFVRDVQLLFARTCRGYGTGTQVGEVLRATLALVRRHGVRVDANYATLILNILCLDGLAQGLVPEYNVVDGAHALLAFHDRVKRLPGGARAARLLLPLGQALKARQDRRFFRRLLRAQRREEEDLLLRGALEEEGGGGGGGGPLDDMLR